MFTVCFINTNKPLFVVSFLSTGEGMIVVHFLGELTSVWEALLRL